MQQQVLSGTGKEYDPNRPLSQQQPELFVHGGIIVEKSGYMPVLNLGGVTSFTALRSSTPTLDKVTFSEVEYFQYLFPTLQIPSTNPTSASVYVEATFIGAATGNGTGTYGGKRWLHLSHEGLVWQSSQQSGDHDMVPENVILLIERHGGDISVKAFTVNESKWHAVVQLTFI